MNALELAPRVEVAPSRIEAALAERWRCLGEAAAERKAPPIARAFLWNLIVTGPTDQTPRLVDELAEELPGRAVVLLRRPEADARLRVFVETNFSRRGVHAVGSDEVIIEIGGNDAQAAPLLVRVPSIVRSILVPDALTALVWIGAPPSSDHVTRLFLGDVDRLIFDTRRIPPEQGEAALGDIVHVGEAHPELELTDLAWLGLSPLRGLCASMFDPPRDPTPLWSLDEVVVVSGVEGVQVRGLIMLGWLGARLGWREPSQMRAERPGQRRFSAKRADGGTVQIRIETDLSGARHGVRRLELVSGEQRWWLARDYEKIEVACPGAALRQHPARSHTVGERLAEALGGKGRDPNYRGALSFAAALAGAV